eukprot:TRINITY_DN7894_c0_g1_i3.p1 TRINITY_DN7894_c0_g1~~TRINITY_DN7894_c0_g1_i3.p1  ORF type:complete len:334 (-),score=102.47 TRINITY_DN7894_c0_g1_i3:83-973(-)
MTSACSYKGRQTTAEEQIDENIKKANRHAAELDRQYNAWLEDMKAKKQEELRMKVREKSATDGNFAAVQAQLAKQRAAVLAEKRAEAEEVSGEYYAWLGDTLDKVRARPASAPAPPRQSELDRADHEIRRRLRQRKKEAKVRSREYKSWVSEINKTSFRVPPPSGKTLKEQSEEIAASAKKGLQKLSATTKEYKHWLADMQGRQQERQEQRLRDKREADKKFDHERELRALALDERRAEEKALQDKVAADTYAQVEELSKRAEQRPLIMEEAYYIGRFLPSQLRASLQKTAAAGTH